MSGVRNADQKHPLRVKHGLGALICHTDKFGYLSGAGSKKKVLAQLSGCVALAIQPLDVGLEGSAWFCRRIKHYYLAWLKQMKVHSVNRSLTSRLGWLALLNETLDALDWRLSKIESEIP
jgi:hypothetical protein